MQGAKSLAIIILMLVFLTCQDSRTQYRFVELDGSEIHYKVSGTGKNNLLFIHGWGCDLNVWHYQEAHFKNSNKVILVDLPGFGKSGKNFKRYDIQLFAQSILKVLHDLDIQQVHLIGHSLGHPIAREVAKMQPSLVNSISIVDGVYFDFPKDADSKTVYKEQLNQFATMFSGEERLSNTRAFVNSLFIKFTTDEVRSYTDTTMMQVPEKIGANIMNNLIKEEVWYSTQIECKTLAVYANIPELPENNRLILNGWYPNLNYVEMDSVGHFLMMERPKLFNQILDDFIQDQ